MLDFFIDKAYAQGAASQGSALPSLLMFGVLFVVFYFLLIRPQMKQAKEHKKMVSEISKGDEIVTSGGLLGKITQVGDNFVQLEVARDMEVKIQKHAISAVMPKGTVKGL